MVEVLICAGTRPEYIRLALTIKKIKKYFTTRFVWLAQNYDPSLSDIFFKDFNLRPDLIGLQDKKVSGINFIAEALKYLDVVIEAASPKCLLVLGDTNTALAAVYTAKRYGVPVVHIEAGNRCFDPLRVPEEINRYAIDAIADWHLCYTQRSREHLLLEGKRPDRAIVVGNPIVEAIEEKDVSKVDEKKGSYILATIHRKENLEKDRLMEILSQLNYLSHQVLLSFHPTLKSKMQKYDISTEIFDNIDFFLPCDFSNFLALEKNAVCVITDSGTCPEECYFLSVPCVLLRYSTERPELLEHNQMVVCSNPRKIKKCVKIAIEEKGDGYPIDDYVKDTSSNIVKIVARVIANEN